MSTSRFAALIGVFALSTASAASYAALLPANGFLLASAVAAPAGGSLAVVDTSTNPFTGVDSQSNVVFSGTEVSTVYAGDTANPLSGLTFLYSVSNNLSSPDAVDRVTISGFAGFTADVGYVTSTGTVPVTVDRSPDGNIIGFSFPGNEILQGATSAELVVHTNAPYDIASTISIIDGGTGTAASFGPSPTGGTPTPEPASLGLLCASGLIALRRRRR